MSINRPNRNNSLQRITGNVSLKSSVGGAISGGDAANGLTPGNGYTYHTFTSTGPLTFGVGPINSVDPAYTRYEKSSVIQSVVTGLSPSASKTVEILLVAGGGGGYSQSGGGGGGVVHYTNFGLSGPSTITVGGGGAVGAVGADSYISGPSFTTLTSKGGGYWDYTTPTPVNRARDVGSGAGFTPDASGKTNNTPAAPQILQSTKNSTYAPLPGFNQYGNSGGGGYANDYQWQGGGGGGAGGAGNNSPRYSATSGGPSGNAGGDGLTVAPGATPGFAGPIIGVPSLNPLGGTYAGGGGGNNENYPTHPAPFGSSGGPGGGGACRGPASGPTAGVQYSGGGGGAGYGGWYNPDPGPAGAGGDGIVVIRYI